MTQRDILVELLRNYRTVEATLVRSEAGSGGHVPLMPEAWNASYRELERSLNVLSDKAPRLARTLLARYVDPTVSRRRLIGTMTAKGVRFANQPAHTEIRSYAQLPDRGHANEWTVTLASWPGQHPHLAATTKAWVYEHRVKEALDWLEQIFQGDAEIPTSRDQRTGKHVILFGQAA